MTSQKTILLGTAFAVLQMLFSSGSAFSQEDEQLDTLAMAAPKLDSLRMSTRLSKNSLAAVSRSGDTPRIYDIEAAIEDGTLDALANSDPFWQQPRTLHVYRAGLKQTIKVTYWENGKYIRSALKQLNRLCRDLHTGRAMRMDKRVFDSLWFAQQVAAQAGYTGPLEITSGYRSPTTNKNLRESGVKAAKNSYHIQGKAVDFRIPDLKVSLLGKMMQEFNRGGVGTYRRESGGWVHVDTGSTRHWGG